MRPDEHKKKKNAAYKKKHGITKDAKEESSKRDKAKSTGERTHESQTKKSDQTKSQLSFHGAPNENETVQAKVINSSSSSSSDSEAATTSTQKSSKSFSRREIVSNWQKYELQPNEEEKVSARGENYEKLLHMAGEAISHFRFKDELDWDDSADSVNDIKNDTYGQFLSVNTAELVQSLACLPMHQILGISQDVFPAEQLSSMMNVAKDKSAVYTAKRLSEETGQSASFADKIMSEKISNSSILHTPHEDNQQNDILSVLNFKMKHHSVLTASPELKKVNKTTSLVIPEASMNTQACTEEGNRDSDINHVTKEAVIRDTSDLTLKKSDKFQLCDDDLEVLLSMDNPASDVVGGLRDASSQKQTTVDSSDVKGDFRPSTVNSSSGEHSKLPTEKDSLEAWLDSVLDD